MAMASARRLLVFGIMVLGAASAAAENRKLEGYAEWRQGRELIVDGQRVRVALGHEFKGKGEARSFDTIPLGYEVKVQAERAADGAWLARKVEARPNGAAMFENDLRSSFDEIEWRFRSRGRVYEEDEEGNYEEYGRLLEDGPEVDRVRHMVAELAPPYVDPDSFRVYVVENEEWNAMAAPNGSIYVFTGLLDNTNDDELALILGHEIAHVTHEHSRREMKKGLWGSLLMAGAFAIAEEIDSEAGRLAAGALAVLGGLAWQNSYGRSCEDQADRVGLRYAYEAGYDIDHAPRLWERFSEKYGDLPKAVHFFLGGHSRSKDRATKLAREIALGYAVSPAAH
jgi:Zn-dependent protease with chaperone function